MSDKIMIRPVSRDDFEEWLVLWDGYNTFYERTLPREITDMTWSRFFDAYEPVNAMVAVVDGAVVGLVHYIFHRSTTMIEPNCYLQDLFTLDSTRGKGVGRALIEAVAAKAKEAGLSRVYWQTHETNQTARLLYDKVAVRSGFIVYRIQL